MRNGQEQATATIYDATSLLGSQRQHIADVALYIDADNQSAHGVKALIGLFGRESVMSAVIAGNNHGKEIESWRQALVAEIPAISLCLRNVSPRKQAADIALIMELGANLDRHIRDGERIVIVSRDELLISAAEHAKSFGCRVFIAYLYCENQPARSTQVTTLLLPALAKASAQIPASAESKAVPVAEMPKTPTAAPAMIATLRGMCTAKPGGGYGASEVGQALSKLGFKTKAERTKFLESIVGLQERGTGPGKVLVF